MTPQGMTGRHPLVVLESFPEPRPTTNPYLVQLKDSLPSDVSVRTFTWRNALIGSYDVFHVHWPENLLRGSSRPRTLARRLAVAVMLARLSLLRIPVVRTLHNSSPHESGGTVERALLRWFDRLTAAWIRLSLSTLAPSDAPIVTIPHGHYRDWFVRVPRSAVEPGRIAFVGMLRPYKGVEDLVDAFHSLPDRDLRLRIAGRPMDPALHARVTAAAHADDRIELRLEHLDDAGIADEVGRAELVVLPYRKLENSGVALLALSLDRPVLLPRGTTAAELAAEVGEGWVTTYEGTVTGADLIRALDEVRRADLIGPPDLSAREWPAAGEMHATVLRGAVAVGRRGPAAPSKSGARVE